MGYERDRDDRFRGQGQDQDRWQGDRDRGSGDNDRGFIDRAGDQVRSWLGDDDAQRRREQDERRYERERGMSGGRDYGRNDRPQPDRGRPSSASSYGNQSDDRYGAGATGGGMAGDYDADQGGAAETWGGSGFGGNYDRGRRFDRIDAGSTGTQGAHPMSSPVGGGYGNAGYGGGYSGSGSSARGAAIIRQSQGQGGGDQHHHDRHYSEWRNRQMEELDRDYHEYRQENQSKFEQEFGGWRTKRQGQRQHMGRVTEHMEVLGSDGQHIGTVDKVKGDRIILTKNDENAGGMHHSIPCSWIETVEDKVTVNKTSAQAMQAWTNEDGNRALFEREDQGSDGPHVLNRSFSGTYDEKKG